MPLVFNNNVIVSLRFNIPWIDHTIGIFQYLLSFTYPFGYLNKRFFDKIFKFHIYIFSGFRRLSLFFNFRKLRLFCEPGISLPRKSGVVGQS